MLVNIWRFARGWPVNAEAALEMPKNKQMYISVSVSVSVAISASVSVSVHLVHLCLLIKLL